MNIKKHTLTGIQSIWIPLTLLGGLLILSLIIQLTLSWLSYNQIVPVKQHANQLEQIQNFLYQVETTLSQQLPEDKRLKNTDRIILKQSLQNLLDQKNNLSDSTPTAIRLGRQVLNNKNATPQEILLKVLYIIRKTFQIESTEHIALTHALYKSSQLKIKIGIIILIVLPISTLMIIFLMRYRIYVPLQQMGLLMKSLGNKHYDKIPTTEVDPLFYKLFENYNSMVQRLSLLENEHLRNEQALQKQVQKAARTLIKQQQNLANTERLAALGEVMARISHELRNPLAGVQMACSNIKTDMADQHTCQEYLSRLTMMCSEIDRIIDLLNSFLSLARHNPEPLTLISINTTINDLLKLVKYQIPEHIKLQYQPTENIHCHLPENQFQQALLNLILNAKQAMGDKPGRILLEVFHEYDRLVVHITDEGPGFSSELLNSNIRSFSSSHLGGTGLGLSMVNRFIHNHNGELLLSNLAPLGARVTLKLPCEESSYD